MEKFCLKWNDFESNIRESFRKLREDQKLFDVTLATEDGQEVKAHKVVLLAGSNFFSDIFLRNNHSNIYIFLKGVIGAQLEQITDFLYYGEASISQDEMKQFFETARMLQVKSLQGDLQTFDQEEQEPKYEIINKNSEIVYENKDDLILQESFGNSLISSVDSVHNTIERQTPLINFNNDLDHRIEELIERTEDDRWKCKVCGKIAKRTQTKRHAETHIEGLSFTCTICSQSCSTRQYLYQHISKIHKNAK